MQAAAALARLGGVADARSLLRLTTRRSIRRAVRAQRIVRLARGRYALPTASVARQRAAELGGVVALRSAAAHHGWGLKSQPERPEVAVRPDRHLSAERREDTRVLWTHLAADQVADGVTTPLRTIIDCARRLPFDEALAVADSALRSGLVTRDDLAGIDVRGAGADAVRRVLRHADGRAANPFESVLRALCIEAGLDVEPQVALDLTTGVVHPDLVCPGLMVVLEADSWTHHSTRRAHTRDCSRYNLLVLHGWRVLRFTWEQVMHDQAYVRWVLGLLTRRVGHEEVSSGLARPA
jgi:very-short-patch-repair endonuclease